MRLALDIGSASIKAVAFKKGLAPVRRVRMSLKGQAGECLKQVLQAVCPDGNAHDHAVVAVTGSMAAAFAGALGLNTTDDVVAAFAGASFLAPDAGAILEIGGEHSRFIRLARRASGGNAILRDFASNSLCSSGTGSFLSQEAHRFGLTIEEFGRLAAMPAKDTPIAGRCAVFAKTDAVHLHQTGVPIADIAASLCRSVARNAAAELVKNRAFERPLAFIGGAAANAGLRLALQEALQLTDGELIVPPDFLFASAIGAYLDSIERDGRASCCLADTLRALDNGNPGQKARTRRWPPLGPGMSHALKREEPPRGPERAPGDSAPVIGVDVGSTTTNIVCLSSSGRFLEGFSLPTQGRTLAAVCQGLERVRQRYGPGRPRAVGVTGSGRKFVAEIIGADLVLNEITAHAAGGAHFFPGVETIFDIGGQDSKYIRIDNGTVVDFAMNRICSAGTGSFLEEMSELLGLKIVGEFAAEALRSGNPADLGERCTVFIGTESARRLQSGCRREDLAAGLCYSVVRNYLSRVVARHPVGDLISFQGGVAANSAVVAALEHCLQKKIQVHPYHHVAGAFGVALEVTKNLPPESRFRGFRRPDAGEMKMRSFACARCSNRCQIQMTSPGPGLRVFSGGICDRYENMDGKTREESRSQDLDAFELREELLAKYLGPGRAANGEKRIGLPRALIFHELIPLWSVFFRNLGYQPVFSGPTSPTTLQRGIAVCPADPCLPVRIAYGHCAELQASGFPAIFIPSISNLAFQTRAERLSHICPAIQAWPYTARSLWPDYSGFLTPTIRLAIPHYLRRDIVGFGASLGFRERKVLAGFEEAAEAQREFYSQMENQGRRLLSGLEGRDTIAALILSRPYTAFDDQTRLRLNRVLKDLKITPIPLDMLPGARQNSRDLEGMYWYYGKRFLQAAREIISLKNGAVIHLGNFGCGSDSFIIHFLRKTLAGVPFLELELDEHYEFTGIRTRLEAFVHSFSGKKRSLAAAAVAPPRRPAPPDLRNGRVLVPQMSDHAFAGAAAFRACSVPAEVLPLPDEESIELGKQAVIGHECLPCTMVVGDMLRYLRGSGGAISRPIFFMISGDGPCRLGQYPYLQRLILDERGRPDVPIFNASQDQTFYEQLGVVTSSFMRKAWEGSVAIDLLFRKWREMRCRCPERDTLDAAYREEVGRLSSCIEHRTDLVRGLRRSFGRLETFSADGPAPRITIAVLGENYVRCNSAANGRIADVLEGLGAEVWFPSLFEWVYYTNWTARLHCLYERQYARYARLLLIDAYQKRISRRLVRAVKGRLRNLEEPKVSELFRMAGDFVPPTFEGETIIGVGRTLDFYRRGAAGAIHVVPFGCIVGTIVETLSERLSRVLGGFPILTLKFDGRENRLPASRLEGFLMQARLWKEKGGDHEDPGDRESAGRRREGRPTSPTDPGLAAG